jgi:hypothetical protein
MTDRAWAAPGLPRGLELPELRDGLAGVVVGALGLREGARLTAGPRTALLLAATAGRPVAARAPSTAGLEEVPA